MPHAARGDKPADKPTAKEDLAAAIANGIKMLKDGKTTEFLERYLTADDIGKLKKGGHWDEITVEFKNKHADDLLKALKYIQDVKPKLSEDGETATFGVSKLEGKHPPELKFHKVKDVWYINLT
jgi:hypothetical protein